MNNNKSKKSLINIDKGKMCIYIDTREQQCRHITNYFDEYGIKYAFKKLDFGDYSFLYSGENFEFKFSIERKNSIDELSGNLKYGRKKDDGTRDGGRDRFKREHERMSQAEAKLAWMIEDDHFSDIYDWMYRSKMNPNAYIGSILSFQYKYDLNIHFINHKQSAIHIYNLCYYYLRNELIKRSESSLVASSF
jgi:ERCC4-type nuclease